MYLIILVVTGILGGFSDRFLFYRSVRDRNTTIYEIYAASEPRTEPIKCLGCGVVTVGWVRMECVDVNDGMCGIFVWVIFGCFGLKNTQLCFLFP